jgi:hypothetical protein
MKEGFDEKDPGRPKAVTNADEQDVAVNHSTADQGGYAEPSQASPQASNESKQPDGEERNEKKAIKAPQSSQSKSNTRASD